MEGFFCQVKSHYEKFQLKTKKNIVIIHKKPKKKIGSFVL